MDQIHIKNLEVYAHHGVFPEENALGQRFVISASLFRIAFSFSDFCSSV